MWEKGGPGQVSALGHREREEQQEMVKSEGRIRSRGSSLSSAGWDKVMRRKPNLHGDLDRQM